MAWMFVNLLVTVVIHLVLCVSSEDFEQQDLFCSFDEDSCNWDGDNGASPFWWKIETREVNSRSGAQKDHTTGDGGFISLQTSYSQENGSLFLLSPPIQTTNETCFSFWYTMYGVDVNYLKVNRIDLDNTSTELFSMFGSQGDRWYRGVIETGTGKFRIQIQATYDGKRASGDIAIDDISFSFDGTCQEKESELRNDQPRFDCDFEKDLCSWSNIRMKGMSWMSTRSPTTNIKDRYPLHPYTDGHSYAKLVRDVNEYYTDQKLSSPMISVDNQTACMRFWYKLSGSVVNHLAVRKSNFGLGHYYQGETLLTVDLTRWIWYQAKITLPQGDHYYISFDTTSRRNGDSELYIDDITLTTGGPCQKEDELLINCDFEDNFCLWYMKSQKDKTEWVRAANDTPTDFTGPSGDHTTGDGHYILMDASKVKTATLYSRAFDVDQNQACLSFWYYMYGADVETLKVGIVNKSYYGENIIWSRKGNQGNKWIQQNITIPPSEQINLEFTASRSYFPRADIALDDISIIFGTPCQSDIVPETTTVASSMVTATLPTPGVTYQQPSTARPSTTQAPPLETPVLLCNGSADPVYENSRVEFKCEAEGSNLNYRWFKSKRVAYLNDAQIYTDTNTNSESQSQDSLLMGLISYRPEDTQQLKKESGSTLVFDEIQTDDTGYYACQVWSFDRGSSNHSIPISVNVVPDTRPKPILRGGNHGFVTLMEIGESLKLMCGDLDVTGGVYHWKTTSGAFSPSQLPNSRFMYVNGTQPKHSGEYSCRISKDEYFTAKSNVMNISVVPGKECQNDYQCGGKAYKRDCRGKRCKCANNAVIRGNTCQMAPSKPIIKTFPAFLEFGLGESFYIICEARQPVPLALTYGIRTPQQFYYEYSSVNIVKINNATSKDGGYYTCSVLYDDIPSEPSNHIAVQIKEFVNLSCDFATNFCEWSHGNATATFSHVTSDFNEVKKSAGPFIQLDDKGEDDVPTRAVLISPTIERTSLPSCLTFKYLMNDLDVYSLTVWKYTHQNRYDYSADRVFAGTNLWTTVGKRGKRWRTKKITIPKDYSFYIAFEAVGPVALDEIVFTYRDSC